MVQAAAAQRRGTARALLRHAAPLVEARNISELRLKEEFVQRLQAATRDGLADLTHVTMLIETELQALDNQDAAARLGIGPASPRADAQATSATWGQKQSATPPQDDASKEQETAPSANTAQWRPR